MSEQTLTPLTTPKLSDASTHVDVLRACTAVAADIFASAPRRRVALTYLNQRGVDAAALSSEWVLGYAPPAWTNLVAKLRGEFSEETLLAAGVARRSSRGSLIDAFRDRVMFGIRAPDGTVAGFIGRDQSGQPSAPKYLNTHQHPAFDKGSLLFGLHEGAELGATQPVIVEGPIDVLAIAARQRAGGVGRLLPLAPCGTAVTDTQARTIAELAFKTCSPVVVAMDGDAPGRAASTSAGEQLRRAGLDVRIATLPSGADPADYLARPAAGLEVFDADCGVPLLTIQVRDAIANQGDRIQWVEGRLAALRSLTAYLGTYPPSYTAAQIGWIAGALDLHPTTVTSELVNAYRSHDRYGPEVRRVAPTVSDDSSLALGM